MRVLVDENVNLFKEIIDRVRNILDNSNGRENGLLFDVRRLVSHQLLYFLVKFSAHLLS